MGFSTNTFLFIFLISLLLVYIPVALFLPKLRIAVLLIASFVFYAWASYKAIPVLIILILIDYIFGMLVDMECQRERRRRSVLLLAIPIILNVGILIYFKYAEFVLGISFMTLSGISYLVDIYRRKIQAQKNILDFALYLSFFVKITEGPIIRYSDVSKQIRKPSFTADRFAEGIRRFSIGLGKKVLLADQIGVVAHDILTASNNSPAIAWLGIISYTLQLYLDFSGYSDMAIGLGKMFGFDFKENFNNPYVSTSLTDFWRRWHISLSNWLRDYIYIPIGGSRSGITYVNLFVTFLIAGFWHGATWNFILWGGWHGLILCIEKFARKHSDFHFPVFLQHVFTLLFIVIGWVFFYFNTVSGGFTFLASLFGLTGNMNSGYTLAWYLSQKTIVVLIVSIVACTPAFDRLGEKMRENRWWDLGYLAILAFSLFAVMSSTFQSFLYFKY